MMSATSLASQQFSGRRRSFSTSTSSSSSTNESRIRFSSSVRAPRGVTARVGLGKVRSLALISFQVLSLVAGAFSFLQNNWA